MIAYSYVELLYTTTWAFCIVRLFQLGQCEGLRVVGWARRIPRFLFCRGETCVHELSDNWDSIGAIMDRKMPLPFVRVVWNKFEVALLLDTYEKVVKGELVRKVAIAKLSNRLRYRKIKNGIEVNEKYRNENGIQLQLSIMENIITNGEKGLASTSHQFEKIVQLASENHDEYIKLLNEANLLYPEPLSIEEKRQDELLENSSLVNESIPQDNLLVDRVKEVLSKKFSKGFRLNSAIDKKRFYKSYEEIVGCSLDITDDDFSNIVSSCGIQSDGKIYVASELMPSDIQDEITSYIESTLESGKGFVFYESLFCHFKEKLLDTPVANVTILCTWLHYKYDQEFYFYKEYMTRDYYVDIDIDHEVISYMCEQWQVKNEDEVVKALDYLPEDSVRFAFNHNPNVLIAATRGMRFHIDKFEVNEEELKDIIFIIKTTIEKFQFIGADELFDYIHHNLPQLISNNSDIPELGIRKALAVLLGDKFDFNNAVISKKGVKLSAGEALLAFAKSHEEFTIEEVDKLARSLGTIINYHLEPLLKYSIRINDKEFVAKNKVHFDVVGIDRYLEKLIKGEVYSIPLKNIHNFATFPECNYPWTSRLLESYLLTASNAFKLYFSENLNKNNVCGVVSFKHPDLSFNVIMKIILARNDVKLTKKDALEFLAAEGYIVQRRNSNIEEILIDARKLREMNIKKQ